MGTVTVKLVYYGNVNGVNDKKFEKDKTDEVVIVPYPAVYATVPAKLAILLLKYEE